MGRAAGLHLRRSLLGGPALQPLPAHGAEAAGKAGARCRLPPHGRRRAGVHRLALRRGWAPGQSLRQRSSSRQRPQAAPPSLGLRRRSLDRLHGFSRRPDRHPRHAGVGPARRRRGRRLLAIRAGLRLHARRRHGRPHHLSAHLVEGGRQAARLLRDLHAQVHPRRLALRRAHQLLRPGHRHRQEPIRRRGGLVARNLQCARRAVAPWRRAHRHHLLHRQLIQGAGAEGARASKAASSHGRQPTSPTAPTTVRPCSACRRTATASKTGPPTCA
jgi:hypothetical protein